MIYTENHRITDWSWKMVPVDPEHCPEDKLVRAMVNTYQMDIDDKYGTIVTRFKRVLGGRVDKRIIIK
jgi:hypothetical protein